MTDDPFEYYDAAYVLGALGPAERRDFERHLDDCARCSTAVRELAGMPGIMSHASPPSMQEPVPPVPETLLPRLLAIRDHERRRRRWITTAMAASAATVLVVIVAVTVTLTGGPDDAGTGGADGGDRVAELAFEQVVDSPVHAFGDLNDMAWGTRIDLNCTYDTGNDFEVRSYKLVVEGEKGNREQVAVWKVRPGQDVALTGSTDLSPEEIASIDIVTVDGTSLLRAKP